VLVENHVQHQNREPGWARGLTVEFIGREVVPYTVSVAVRTLAIRRQA
jgi:hypothetical protein